MIVRTPLAFGDNTMAILQGFMTGAINASTATGGQAMNLGMQPQVVQAPVNYTPYLIGAALLAVILMKKD